MGILSHETQEEFIALAEQRHPGKYIYTNVVYKHKLKDVEVICPTHGSFMKAPISILYGMGCPHCPPIPELTTETFIEEARKIHGDRYLYHNVDYFNMALIVEVMCPNHGPFLVQPYSHLYLKQGCFVCKCRVRDWKKRLEPGKFVGVSRREHGMKYDYTQMEWVDSMTPVKLVCPEHGSFMIAPAHHAMGQGCPKCAIAASSLLSPLDVESFIPMLKSMWGEQFTLQPGAKIVNYLSKVEFLCRTHKETFMNTPAFMLLKSRDTHIGCQTCIYGPRMPKEVFIKGCGGRPTTLFILRMYRKHENFFRVGTIATTTVAYLATETSLYKHEIIKEVISDAGRIYDLETESRAMLNIYRHPPEYSFRGRKECYTTVQPLLDYIDTILPTLE